MASFKSDVDDFGLKIIPLASLHRIRFEPKVTLVALVLMFLTYRFYVVIYRLYFHRLAGYPGPCLAGASTLYRAYHQCWKDGRMLEHATQLHKIYGPVVRIAPNEKLHFRNPTAYHDICSNAFDGIKDPDFYAFLGGEVPTFFDMGDPVEYKARFRPVASLFAKRFFDQCEPSVKRNVERFSELLSVSARTKKPSNLALGYRSLFLSIVNEFVFSSVPDRFQSLADETFEDPLAVTTASIVNWVDWFRRNFPNFSNFVMMAPPKIVSYMTSAFEPGAELDNIVHALVEHELDPSTPKSKNSMVQRLVNAHTENTYRDGHPHPRATLRAEAAVTMMGGFIDLSNILPYATFQVANNLALQEKLYEELKNVWPDSRTLAPDYEVLRHLPYLSAILKESMRLTHGVVSGPAREVGPTGAHVDGYYVPPKAAVTTSSYYVHMDPTIFPDPEKFMPERWFAHDHSDSVVVFGKGRRMCPASHFSYMEMYHSLATVFRRFMVTPYETSEKNFQWRQYFSIEFMGPLMRAMLEERRV
ncbi:cytochrome p450 domain-containing protein [Penicillium longicatenatum]|nr:cytochrome p450 domain-containing protein [Penicillium longicatenatum]